MIVLRFALTEEDHFKFNYYRYWLSPAKKKAKFRYYLKTVLYTVIGFSLIHLLSRRPLLFVDVMIYTSFIILMVLLIPALVRNSIKKNVQRLLKDPKNASYLTPTEISFNENGIDARDQFSESRHEWAAIVRKEETREYYYLYLNSMLVITIPKRVFTTELERKEFDLCLSRHITVQAEWEDFKNT